jgi:hypothetical protein
VALALPGCFTVIDEKHYFQSLRGERVTNYYRLRVSGGAAFSSARYISGYYDERAVDLFFNELKTTPTTDATRSALFPETLKDPGTEEVIKPLSPTDQTGAFVIVLSTNARAVTDAIGQFAENQAVADAITNIVNRDQILGGGASSEVSANAARTRELEQLFARVPADATPGRDETVTAYLRIVGAIARAEGHTAPFADLDSARRWLEAGRP